ncbi:MAG: NAD(P)-dependent oxidoreductase [Desulfobacteraceae bacterium]|nr:MAG: NAD(P)-dependent oxidoreductase [Desulfobacteraceae bacterium]
MRIALVGGAGFIGHHLALKLRGQGHDCLIVDSKLVNNLYTLGHGQELYRRMLDERESLLDMSRTPVLVLDARNYHLLSHALSAYRPDTVLHLAAVAHIDRSRKDPLSTFDHSLVTLENALDVSVALGVQRFVYFSSSTVYGNFPSPVVDEETPCNPIGTYGSLKLAGELMVKAYRNDKGLPYTIVRPQALYGERCISRRVVQCFIEAALEGSSLRIAGDGTAEHDFTYIEDLVDGVCAALRSEAAVDQTFCITAAEARSLDNLAEIVTTWIPASVEHGSVDDKPKRGTMSVDKARSLLNWGPRYDLDEGVKNYIRWYTRFWKEKRHAA